METKIEVGFVAIVAFEELADGIGGDSVKE